MNQEQLQPELDRMADYSPVTATFRAEVLDGLRLSQKELPCKYLYDVRGARLFEEICELPEYYPTRTEMAIMDRQVCEMADRLGPHCLVIEFGSGAGVKTRILLEALHDPSAYVPIDIACEQLAEAADSLREEFPDLDVHPICADYTDTYELPVVEKPVARRVVYFPGSTIGNFDPDAARKFLQHIREVCGDGGGLLLGVDLKKERAVLERAYNDAAGVTAAFNLNLLRRLKHELGADIVLDQFSHQALYNEERNRIEMHLVSLCEQTIRVGDEEFHLRTGETIHTENSYKYSLAGFDALATEAGFAVKQVWTDPDGMFSVQYLETVS